MGKKSKRRAGIKVSVEADLPTIDYEKVIEDLRKEADVIVEEINNIMAYK